MFDNLLKGGTNLLSSVFGLGQYLINLFMGNPLWFLGGLLILRASQKGAGFNLGKLLKKQ